MRIAAILKDMAFGGGTASLKVVGSLAFPGAWPIIEGALDPVIDLLKKRLGVEDPLDEQHAPAAWTQLLTDDALVELFESRLQLAVAPLRASHEQLEEGQRRLLQLLDGNADTLRVIQEDLESIRISGVMVASPSVNAIRSAVGEEFTKRVCALEQRLDQLITGSQDTDLARNRRIRDRFRDQLARTQARAVELLNGQEFDRATDELRAGMESLELLIDESPDNVDLRVNLGYYYKTIAATFASIGKDKVPASIDRTELAKEFNERAMTIFYFVARGLPLDRKTARDQAHALNGVGNIHYARGHYRLAIENYALTTRIDPHYCYAWHDLFAAHYALALQGDVDFPAMRHALDKTRETGQGQPGLGAKRLEQLEQTIARFDPDAIAGRLIEEALNSLEAPEELRELAQHPLTDARPAVEDPDLERALRTLRRGATQEAQRRLAGLVDDFERDHGRDARHTAVALCQLGSTLASHDAQAAYRHYRRAVELAPGWADAWHDLGAILTHLEHMSEATEAFLRSAIQARATGNRQVMLFALENTAIALSAQASGVGVGIRMLRGLLYAYHSTDDREGQLRLYWKLVELDIHAGNLDEAEHFAQRALHLAERTNALIEQAKFVYFLAQFAEARGDRLEALANYQRAQRLFEETGPEELIQQTTTKIEEMGLLVR